MSDQPVVFAEPINYLEQRAVTFNRTSQATRAANGQGLSGGVINATATSPCQFSLSGNVYNLYGLTHRIAGVSPTTGTASTMSAIAGGCMSMFQTITLSQASDSTVLYTNNLVHRSTKLMNKWRYSREQISKFLPTVCGGNTAVGGAVTEAQQVASALANLIVLGSYGGGLFNLCEPTTNADGFPIVANNTGMCCHAVVGAASQNLGTQVVQRIYVPAQFVNAAALADGGRSPIAFDVCIPYHQLGGWFGINRFLPYNDLILDVVFEQSNRWIFTVTSAAAADMAPVASATAPTVTVSRNELYLLQGSPAMKKSIAELLQGGPLRMKAPFISVSQYAMGTATNYQTPDILFSSFERVRWVVAGNYLTAGAGPTYLDLSNTSTTGTNEKLSTFQAEYAGVVIEPSYTSWRDAWQLYNAQGLIKSSAYCSPLDYRADFSLCWSFVGGLDLSDPDWATDDAGLPVTSDGKFILKATGSGAAAITTVVVAEGQKSCEFDYARGWVLSINRV